jgi:hypothetical protein
MNLFILSLKYFHFDIRIVWQVLYKDNLALRLYPMIASFLTFLPLSHIMNI